MGRMVDKHGIRPDPDAVEAVLTWKSPKTEHQLMRFLGFANYYRDFIKGYADKVYPMQQLKGRKGKKLTWNNAVEESFQRINRHANRERKVRVGHGCIGGSDLRHTPSRARVERENSLETNSIRE